VRELTCQDAVEAEDEYDVKKVTTEAEDEAANPVNFNQPQRQGKSLVFTCISQDAVCIQNVAMTHGGCRTYPAPTNW
jgi:hypothetical protein